MKEKKLIIAELRAITTEPPSTRYNNIKMMSNAVYMKNQLMMKERNFHLHKTKRASLFLETLTLPKTEYNT